MAEMEMIKTEEGRIETSLKTTEKQGFSAFSFARKTFQEVNGWKYYLFFERGLAGCVVVLKVEQKDWVACCSQAQWRSFGRTVQTYRLYGRQWRECWRRGLRH